jgi:hypothetical protein
MRQLHLVEHPVQFSSRKATKEDAAFIANNVRPIVADKRAQAIAAVRVAKIGVGD